MGKRETGKETSTVKVKGKRGREINNKAGKIKSHRKVCYLAGRTGTVEILMGFLNSRVTDSLTDRDRPMYTDSHTPKHTHTLAHAVHAVHRTDYGWHYNLDFLRSTACS